MNRTIVWFRRDLRIADHAPLYRAALRGEVIPVFVFDRASYIIPKQVQRELHLCWSACDR
jgi:deoxyribodipyrimidine photolyase